MKKHQYEWPFIAKPPTWKAITFDHTRQELKFAIDQLEMANKPYAIEKLNNGRIIIWTSPR